ncbi:hypothetical protein [uncultured Desulfosarcina sp.]|uniref:LVIVD repeat-containing protein n=1 Tax=uncultured Desulfosarcina sp. TaxID=218289 RepID=UPI0029C78F9F|nr:hypothetical protein [uncultured Desulfosarcina sp.]
MKLASCFCALLIATILAASTALADPVLTNGDRWPFGSPRAVTVGGGYVYMARGNVLTILNSSLVAQSAIDLGAEIRCICYSEINLNGYIFAAMGSAGLSIVDVSTPTAPSVESTFEPADGTSVGSVFTSGNYAYIANVGNRFKIVDVSDPTDPDTIGEETLSGLLVSAVSVHVSGNVAAVVDQVNGLHLINVSSKSNPQWESVTAIAGAFDAHLDVSYAYVASISGGLDIVDISDLSDPELRGSYTPTDGYCLGLFVYNNTAWLADQVNGLHEISIADKDAPSLQQTYGNATGAYSTATDDGTNVYVCDHEQGIQRVAGGGASYESPCEAINLYVDDDDYLYVVSGSASGNADDEGLRILDAYYAGNIGYEGFVETPGQAYGVFVDGDYAYVADGDQGLQIIDVSDKASPAIVGTCGTTSAQAVFVSGNYAYVADGSSGLRVIDASTKASPAISGSYDTSGTAYGVYVSGRYAYVADGDQGLQIIDVSDKSSPSVVGSYNTDGTARGVFVQNGYAYIADGTNGLVVLDVSDPTDPSKISAWSTGTTAEALGVHVVGEYVYVAEGLGGAAIYYLTDEEPFEPTTPPSSGGGGGCFIANLGF